jgi:two-component system response regulator AtoC
VAGERVLILEDDPLLQSVLADRLRHEGLDVLTASTLAEARKALEVGEPDVALCDLRLPDGESLTMIREVAPRSSAVFVVMTAHATVATAVEALKLGAKDYLEKPFTLDRAVATIRQALEMTALRREVAALRDRSSHARTTVIAESPAMRRVFELVELLASVDATTVLIEGESGTGKGAVAQALHRLSRRASGPFLNITCSALPETLMESELFGHEKGAFTDAHTAKRGLVEMAERGTLVLDEIGELTPGVQAKLLRFIEEKTFRRLGGTRDLTVDVRIMTATNRDLAAEVAAGHFRADLYYRLRVIPITLPPLRERPEDVAPIAKHFVAHFAREFAKRIGEITPEALALLASSPWPGNVRELRNVMERAVLLADGSAIGVKELPPELSRDGAGAPGGPAASADAGTLEAVERRLLSTALDRAHGNQSRAAEALGISRHQIRTRMRRYGLLGLVGLTAAVGAGPTASARSDVPVAGPRCHGAVTRPSTLHRDAPC